jgi:very-short-patch-repair endonuclease
MKSKGNSLSYDASIKGKARTLRNNPTPAEKIFWNALRRMSFYKSLTFNRQKHIEPYIVDFYCHRLSLVIEIDGDSHGENEAKVYDQKRTAFLESKGLTVLRFTNPEVNNNVNGVMVELEVFVEKRIDVNHPDPL